MTVPIVHVSRVHIHKRGRHLSHCKKGVWVRVRVYLLHDDIRANGDEAMAVTVGKGVVVHLARQGVCCVLCTPGQRNRTQSNCVLIHFDEKQEG